MNDKTGLLHQPVVSSCAIIGEDLVMGIDIVVTNDIASKSVVAGNPATEIKRRVLKG